MWSRFERVVIRVRDLGSAVSTYASLFGAHVARGPDPLAGDERFDLPLENGGIELMPMTAHEIEAHAGAELTGIAAPEPEEGVYGLVLGCADLEETVRRLSGRGWKGAERACAIRRADDGRSERILEWSLDPEQTYGTPISIREIAQPHASDLHGARSGSKASDRIHAIDHVVLRTEDPERAIELYRDRLELRLALDRSFAERGVRLLFFRLAGVTIEIATALRAREGVSRALGRDTLWGVAYRVSDVAAARARCTAAGFDVSEVRSGNKPGTRVCTVRSPTHGVPTLLIGPALDGSSMPEGGA